MTRRAPMKRTPLKRKARLRPVSKKRRKQLPIRKAVREQVKQDAGGMCQRRGCRNRGVHVHEVVSKGRRGDWLDPANCRLLCIECHDWTHRNPAEATRLGLLASKGACRAERAGDEATNTEAT